MRTRSRISGETWEAGGHYHGGGVVVDRHRVHGLVLHRQHLVEAGVDGCRDQLVEVVEELAAVEGRELPLQVPAHQLVEGVLRGVSLRGDPGVDDGQHVPGIELLQSPLDALRLADLVAVDLIGGRDVDPLD
jgi:hypothetical protein